MDRIDQNRVHINLAVDYSKLNENIAVHFDKNDWENDEEDIEKCIRYINDNNISEITFSQLFKHDQHSLKFLEKINPLQVRLIYADINAYDCDVLYRFENLEELVIHPLQGDSLDLSRFSKLNFFQCNRINNIKNLSSVHLKKFFSSEKNLNFDIINKIITLEELGLYEVNSFTIDKIKNLKTIKTLDVRISKIKDLAGIELLKNLESLTLLYCKNLSDISGLSALKKLRTVYLANCPKVTDLTELGNCVNVKVLKLDSLKNCNIDTLSNSRGVSKLELINCGNVQNLNFIKNMNELEQFIFIDTNIIDGDLTPLLNLKSLKYVGTFDKKHYNLKSNQLPHTKLSEKVKENTTHFSSYKVDLSNY